MPFSNDDLKRLKEAALSSKHPAVLVGANDIQALLARLECGIIGEIGNGLMLGSDPLGVAPAGRENEQNNLLN